MAETYKELQGINTNNFSQSPTTTSQQIQPPTPGLDLRKSGQSSIAKTLGGDILYKDQNQVQSSPFASDYFDTKFWGMNLGAVTDQHKDVYGGLSPFSKAVDWEDLRQNEQSYFSKIPNLVNQYVGKTAINTIGGIIGGFYGLGAAAVNGDASLLFDNSVNRGLDKATDWVENNNSTFTSQKQRDSAPLGLFSFAAVKDFSDAYSFISGAVASELVVGALSGGIGAAGATASIVGRLGKGADFLTKNANRIREAVGLGNGVKTAGNFITRSSEAAKLLSSVDPNDINKLQQVARNLGMAVEDAAKYRKSIDNFNSLVTKGRGVITGTFWEAGLEARHTKDEFIASQTSQLENDINKIPFKSDEEKEAYREKELKRINETADMAGLTTFGLNTVVLGASNYIQFPTIFGKDATTSVNSMRGKLTKDALGNYVKSGNKISNIARAVGSALKEPLTEFTEETLQNSINIGSKSYYDSIMGTRTSDGEITPLTASFSDSMLKGLKETYTSSQGLHEGIVGAIVGAMGVPLLKRNAKGKLRPVLEGGIKESIHEYKEANKSIDESVKELNLNKFDTLLSYNKDNAILSSQDAKKEDVANLQGDKYEVERLKDNMIFRHVSDRLDKGLETYLTQDVQDLKDMDLATYKSSMNKDDSFTKAQKDKEVNDFSDKVDIYADAYKKVFNGLQMDRINNDRVSKKYFDTLSYAVANEKIYNKKQQELTDKLLTNKNIDMNHQELLELARLDDKFKLHEKDINDYIKQREDAKFKEKKDKIDKQINYVRNKVAPEYQALFDDALTNKDDTVGYLTSLVKLQKDFETDAYKDLAASSDIILKNTDTLNTLIEEAKELNANKTKESKFDYNKSSTIRNKQRNGKEILNQIKNDIEEKSSKSLELLRGNKETVTQKELEDYIELKARVRKSIKDDNAFALSKSFLDTLDTNNQDIAEQLKELSNITKHQVMALDIATNLYGLSKTNKAYSTIVNAEFEQNLNNLNNITYNAWAELTRGDDEDYLAELTANLDQALKNMQESLDEYGDLLSDESKKKITDQLDTAKTLNEKLKEYLDMLDTKEEIAAKTKLDSKQKEEKDLVKAIEGKEQEKESADKEVILESEGIMNNIEFNNDQITLFNPKNLHTIKITNSTEPDLVELKRKIDNGDIKYNSAVTISHNDSQEENSGFKKYLEKLNLAESYESGKNKVTANPELLKEKDIESIDPDVKVFIIHSPVSVNIYNKEVELSEGDQDFELEDNDQPEHSFLYFAPNLDINPEVIEKYNKLKLKNDNEFQSLINNLDKQLNIGEEITLENSIGTFHLHTSEIQSGIQPLFNGGFIVSTSLPNNETSTGWLYSKALSGEFATREEATDFVNEIVLPKARNLIKFKSKISQEEYNKRKNLLEKQYLKIKNDLEVQNSQEFNNINDKVLFSFRQQLLLNKYDNGLNELKMRLGNINNGFLEKVGDTTWEVEEFGITAENNNPNYLVEDLNKINKEDILFGNQAGEYVDLNDNKPKLNRGSRVNKTTALTGKLYLKYKTINNQEIPVQLNRSKINSNKELFDEITYQLEQYFVEDKKPNTLIKLKNEKFSFLKGKTYNQFFRSFFDENNSGPSYAGLDSLNIVSDTKGSEQAGNVFLGNLDLDINSLETFNANKEDIITSLGEQRYYLDKFSFINLNDNSFNRPFFDFVFKNNLVNHSFNTSTNSDKIFVPGFDKSIQFHILNSQINDINKNTAPKVKDLTKSLQELLGAKDGKNLSWTNVFYNINGDIITRANKIFKTSGNSKESIEQAFKEVIEEKLQAARDQTKTFPAYYTNELEETLKDNTSFKILASDKILDKYFKIVYNYKNKLQKREKTLYALEEYLKNKNFAAEYKNILLDKKLSPIKAMLSSATEIEEEVDGKTITKTKFKFGFSEALTNNTPEENKARFINIINAFGELDKTARKFVPLIYTNNNKDSSASKVFIDFSKSYISSKGEQYEDVYYHNVDSLGLVSKGPGQSKADGKKYNLAQYSFNKKDGSKVTHNAIEFKVQNSEGELENTKTPLSDFEFNNDGTLKNGIIYLTFINDKGFAEQQPVIIGNNNNLNTNNFIKTIKIPGLNQDFTVNIQSQDSLNELYTRFDTAIDNLNAETVNLYKDNSALKEDIKIQGSTNNQDEEDNTLDDMTAGLLNQFNKTTEYDSPKNTSEPTFKEPTDASFNSQTMFENLNPGYVDPDFNEPTGKLSDFIYSEDMSDEVNNNVTNDIIESLSHEDHDEILDNKDIIGQRLDRLINRVKENKVTKEKAQESFNEYNANTYEKLIEMLNIIYSDNPSNLKKYVNFANNIYNRNDKNENC